jgi:UDP-N-acetylmuramoylalanine--D-glutamate ligase
MPAHRVSEPAMQPEWLRHEVAVLGLARSGIAVATLLARTGNLVYASDASRTPELEAAQLLLERDGVDVGLGKHDVARVARSSLVVVSPGVPPNAEPIVAAKKAGVDVVSEVEIALRFMPNTRYIGITGTNGKTTTTALAAHLLRALDLRAEAAGNIGTPLSAFALESDPPPWLALELSSYQLHCTPSIRPLVGALTNLSPNHLDRYPDVASYYADKEQLFRNSSAASHWVTNGDDEVATRMVDAAAGVKARFSLERRADAHWDRQTGDLVVLGTPLINRGDLKLLGDHNVANALCATLCVMLAAPEHRSDDAVHLLADGLRSFRSLEHRIEVVADAAGVLWINDSKSTNVASTLVALKAMTQPTVLLLGGRHKGASYAELEPELRRTARVVIAYGEAAPQITRDLGGTVTVEQGGSTFADVISLAQKRAKKGDAVLLSPACSSFDMFANYEKRGTEFKKLVAAL